MTTDFLGRFKTWPFCLKLTCSLWKQNPKIPVCKGKAVKGGVEMPSEGNKTSSWAQMDCYKLSQQDICCSPISFFLLKSLENNNNKFKNPKPKQKSLWSFQSTWTYFCHHKKTHGFFFLPSACLWLSLKRSTSLFPPPHHAGAMRVGGEEARRLSKTARRQCLDGRLLLGDLSSCAPLS